MKAGDEANCGAANRLWRLCLMLVVLMCLGGTAKAALINEIRLIHSGLGTVDSFEIRGAPGEDLADLTYVVLSRGTTDGEISHVYPLAGYNIAPEKNLVGFVSADWAQATGYHLYDHVYPGLNFAPGPDGNYDFKGQTHMLVRNFSGVAGQDLDTDDDGELDAAPWQDVLDSVGLPMDIGLVYASMAPRTGGGRYGLVFRPSDGDDWVSYSSSIASYRRDTPGMPNVAANNPPQNVKATPRVAFVQPGAYPFSTQLANVSGSTDTPPGYLGWEVAYEPPQDGVAIQESDGKVVLFTHSGLSVPAASVRGRYDVVITASDLDYVSTTAPLTVLVPGEGGEVTYPIDARSTGISHNTGPSGVSVEFALIDQVGPFDLHVMRVDGPATGPLAGNSALASNGVAITPTRVSPDRYWVVEPVYLTGPVTYAISFDISTMPGVYEPDAVVLMKRNTPGDAWTALDTTYANGVLKASGLTSFSEFTVGGLQGTLVPVALSGFSLD